MPALPRELSASLFFCGVLPPISSQSRSGIFYSCIQICCEPTWSDLGCGMDGLKARKESAMRRWRRLQQVGRALRCLEVGAVLLLLTWFSSHLPAAARCSGNLLRSLATALLSPRAVFLLGNAIVLLLFSGKLSPASSSSSSSDFYDEFFESRGRVWNSLPPPVAAGAEEAVYEDKAVCVETRHYELRRSLSERTDTPRREAPELLRAETEVGRKEAKEEAEKAEEEERSAEDDDDLRLAVEAFIAKQLRFHREESLAIVSSAARPPELIEVK